ncbi:MAG TPA: hypothetical protein VLZ50_03465 [Terracidiphilus sp.]|nr:hypothetical protein [Terracidiphilus sp.]
MRWRIALSILCLAASAAAPAQDAPPTEERRLDTRYSIAVSDDATFYGNLRAPLPTVLNQVLVEPTFGLRYRNRWSFSTSLIGSGTTYSDNFTRLRVKETYGGLSAGDFDFTMGRKMLRWGTGYAFTAAGVLDPPRIATDPTDRLNLNVGRDMVKADWVHGPHAVSLVWSTAALAPRQSNLRDATALRYNILVRGIDTSLIAGDDRGGDAFGGLTFTRVVGQAWELHGEAVWREQAAALLGAKYTTHSGVTFYGEFYTPPNTLYFRDAGVSPQAGRPHYAFLRAGKDRLRELPGWKEWGVDGYVVTNLDDRSCTALFDVSRWFGNRFDAYVHGEIPAGGRTSQYGSAPYSTAMSVGVSFHL